MKQLHIGRLLLAAGLILASTGLAFFLGFFSGNEADAPVLKSAQAQPTQTQAPPTPMVDDTWGSPILDAETALARSLADFPDGHNAHGEIVHLISAQTYTTTAGTLLAGISPSEPIWVVTIRGDNLTVSDVVKLPIPDPHPDTSPCIGAKYVWEAVSGGLLVNTALMNEDAYQVVSGLVDESLPIETSTPEPSPTP